MEGAAVMSVNDKAQYERMNFLLIAEQFYAEGPYCWNCELVECDDPDVPMHFCDPWCEKDYYSRQPLNNFLKKRAARRARTNGGPNAD
jgi:hypothetical protein